MVHRVGGGYHARVRGSGGRGRRRVVRTTAGSPPAATPTPVRALQSLGFVVQAPRSGFHGAASRGDSPHSDLIKHNPRTESAWISYRPGTKKAPGLINRCRSLEHRRTSDPIGEPCSKYLGSDRSLRISCRTWVRDRWLRGGDRHEAPVEDCGLRVCGAEGRLFRVSSFGFRCRTHSFEHPRGALCHHPRHVSPLRGLHPLVPKHLESPTTVN